MIVRTHGPHARNLKMLAICAALAAPATTVFAQPADSGAPAGWTPPRTAWGDPDLRGMWPLDLGRTPMQRPENLGEKAYYTEDEYTGVQDAAAAIADNYEEEDAADEIGSGHWFEYGRALRQTSLIMEPANGRIPPLTPEGEARKARMHSSWTQEVFDDISDFNALDRCITRGLPASMVPFPYNNGVEIYQAPGYVALKLEMIHETRIIPLDGRPHLPEAMDTWLGSSVGRWEGDTLVIETTNFNGESPMVIVGPSNDPIPQSPELRITERLTLTGPDTIRYEAFVEDPGVLTAPFKLDFPWTRNEEYEAFEYACHEGNTVIRNYIISTSPRFASFRNANDQGFAPEEWLNLTVER